MTGEKGSGPIRTTRFFWTVIDMPLDGDHLLLFGIGAVGLLLLWLLFKVLKKVILATLIVVAVVGLGLGIYLKFF